MFDNNEINEFAKNFPRSSKYSTELAIESTMGPNVLWLTEQLTNVMRIQPGMRVLDLGSGKALSSIFIAREYQAQVWSADLWIHPNENWVRIKKMKLEDSVFPLRAEAHELPFAAEFFDAIVSLDSYHYYGTDVHYLEYVLQFLKQNGQIGIISPALRTELGIDYPKHLNKSIWYWMNSVEWWGSHWERQPGVKVEICEALPKGCEQWIRWHEVTNKATKEDVKNQEYQQLILDKGENLGFVRMIASKCPVC